MNQIAPVITAGFEPVEAGEPGAAIVVPSPEFDALVATIAAGASERDAGRIHPFEAIELIKRSRLGAIGVPRAFGGGGATISDVIAIVLALAEADTNVAHILRNHFTFIERYVRVQADPRQAKWLQAALDGAIFGLATTELDRTKVGGGGPWHTTLTAVDGGYRLNGTKFYSTGTLYADFILVRADIVDGNHVSVVVPVERDGVERVDDWDGIGQRVTGTGTTNFRDVFIAEDEAIGDEKEASFLLPYTSTIAQLIVTTVVAGAAKAVLRDAKALVKGRTRTFYYANAETADEDPILQQTIGQIAAYAFAAESLVLAAAVKLDRVQAARDRGDDIDHLSQQAALAAAKAKVVVDELALKATTALFDVGGASAATQKRNLDRHWRNARTLASHNPSNLKAQWIGKHELNGARLPDKGFF